METTTAAQMYERLQVMIRQRGDTGFRLAVANTLLEPCNPFESGKRRRPKAAVGITISLLLVLALIFVYFSFLAAR